MKNNQHSNTVSRAVTNHILKRAVKAHFQNIKNRKITQKAEKRASQYPTHCTSQIVSFFTLTPFQQHPEGLEGNDEAPHSPSIRPHFNYTSAFSTPNNFPHLTSPKHTERIKTRGSHQPFENRCIKLDQRQEYDQYIEALRAKKQKLSDLENAFKESEKRQKAKPRNENSKKKTFITDYDGENIDMKPIKRKNFTDSYFRAEVSVAGFREERVEHQRMPTQESFKSKEKTKNISFKHLLPTKRLLSVDYPKDDGISEISQNIPLRQLELLTKRKVRIRQSWKSTNGSEGIAYLDL